MMKHDGFTLLELLVALGIIALVIAVIRPDFADYVQKERFKNAYSELRNQLSSMRSEALSRGTTSRMQLQQVGGVYVMTNYVTPSPVVNCDLANPWQQIYTDELDLPSDVTITGSGVGDVCFFRDGSSTGGQYSFDGTTAGLGTADIIVTIATGYLDVTTTN